MTLAASALSLILSGCTVIITTGIFSDVSSSHGVQIVAAVTSHSAALDTITARVTNAGADAVFIPRCGSGPLLLTQQFVNGVWSDAENPTCPAGSAVSPIQLDPGLTLVAVRVVTQTGRFRFVTTVGQSEDFSQSTRATSNSVAIAR
jgi:hypothetical protein